MGCLEIGLNATGLSSLNNVPRRDQMQRALIGCDRDELCNEYGTR
jgi:hypothetical protein